MTTSTPLGPSLLTSTVATPDETIPDEHGRPFPLLALRGKVPCMVWRPDGSFYIAGFADDPLAAMADPAKRN